MPPNEEDSSVVVPRVLLDKIMASAESLARSAHSIEALEEAQKEMRDDIHAMRASLVGAPDQVGVLERLRVLEGKMALLS